MHFRAETVFVGFQTMFNILISSTLMALGLSLSGCGEDAKFKGAAASENGDAEPKTTRTEDSILPPKTIDGITNDPNTNTVVFGEKGVYRVGDGQARNTSCKQAVFSYELEGAEYSFLFNVSQDSTKVTLQIGRICGIDSGHSNSVKIINVETNSVAATATLETKVFGESDETFSPFASSTLVLPKGKYAIRVVSDHKDGPGSDRDDFIIGNISLKGDKPILGIGIETN